MPNRNFKSPDSVLPSGDNPLLGERVGRDAQATTASAQVAFGVLLERLGAPVGLQGCSWDSLGGPSAALGVLWGCAGVYFVDFERAAPGKTSSRLHGVRILQKKSRSRKGHENKLQRLIGICRLRTTHPTH